MQSQTSDHLRQQNLLSLVNQQRSHSRTGCASNNPKTRLIVDPRIVWWYGMTEVANSSRVLLYLYVFVVSIEMNCQCTFEGLAHPWLALGNTFHFQGILSPVSLVYDSSVNFTEHHRAMRKTVFLAAKLHRIVFSGGILLVLIFSSHENYGPILKSHRINRFFYARLNCCMYLTMHH